MIDRSIVSPVIRADRDARDRVTLFSQQEWSSGGCCLNDIRVRSGYLCGAWCTLLIKEKEEEEKSKPFSQDTGHPGRTVRRRRGEDSR